MDDNALGTALADFVARHHVRVINVAGSRGSGEPGVGTFATHVLDASALV